MKLFLILGNQLFNTKYLSNYKDHLFYLAEDYHQEFYKKNPTNSYCRYNFDKKIVKVKDLIK